MTEHTTSPLYRDLNPEQARAVFHGSGPLLVFAGAGSGKTRVLTYRIAHLILERGVQPWNVLAVTFTNKAADEMLTRIELLLGERIGEGRALAMGTFHSLCARMLRRYGEDIGIRSNFTIYDDADQRALIKRIIKDKNIDDKLIPYQVVAAILDRAKNDGVDPASRVRSETRRDRLLQEVLRAYAEEMHRNNALDFGDLLTEMLRLLDESPEVRLALQQRFEHILVDEVQDTNRVQYELLSRLLGPERNLCLVGDDDQSIYRWRGARIENISDFRKDFPDAAVVVLGNNYRSTRNILDVAAAVISRNLQRQPKELVTGNPKGDPIRLYRGDDEYDEARHVVDCIRSEIRRGAGPGDIAVFYRTNSQSRVIEEELVKSGMSYTVVGGMKFYDRKEVKDVLAYARLVVNPDDSVSLERIVNTPPRGIGAKTWGGLLAAADARDISPYGAMPAFAASATPKLKRSLLDFIKMVESWRERARAGESPSILIADIIDRSRYKELINPELGPEAEARKENVEELLKAIRQYENKAESPSLQGFLEQAALTSDPDNYERTEEAVSLMTLHNAKGLEYPIVLLIGIEDGLLPHVRSLDEPGGEEEERRLFYVGITRAQRLLYLTWAKRRQQNWMGYSETRPSRFLLDVPQSLVLNMGAPQIRPVAFPQHQSTRYSHRDPFHQGDAPIDIDLPRSDGHSQDPGYQAESEPDSAARTGFAEGQRVSHGAFGDGSVLEVEPYAEAQRVTVIFDSGEKKVFLTKWAKLKVL